MNEKLKYNLLNYLKYNNKTQFKLMVMVLILFLGVFGMAITFNIYNIEKINAQIICNEEACNIKFYQTGVNTEKFSFIEIKNQKYKIQDLKYAEPTLNENNLILQEVTLKLKEYSYKNNEIVELKIYKNKEKLIKKILNIILER